MQNPGTHKKRRKMKLLKCLVCGYPAVRASFYSGKVRCPNPECPVGGLHTRREWNRTMRGGLKRAFLKGR